MPREVLIPANVKEALARMHPAARETVLGWVSAELAAERADAEATRQEAYVATVAATAEAVREAYAREVLPKIKQAGADYAVAELAKQGRLNPPGSRRRIVKGRPARRDRAHRQRRSRGSAGRSESDARIRSPEMTDLPRFSRRHDPGSTLVCIACGRSLWPGAALRAIHPREPARVQPVCRPGVSPRCISAVAGWRVELWDVDAAREYDRSTAGPTRDHSRERAFVKATEHQAAVVARGGWAHQGEK
jgi:hypothetical protein